MPDHERYVTNQYALGMTHLPVVDSVLPELTKYTIFSNTLMFQVSKKHSCRVLKDDGE